MLLLLWWYLCSHWTQDNLHVCGEELPCSIPIQSLSFLSMGPMLFMLDENSGLKNFSFCPRELG